MRGVVEGGRVGEGEHVRLGLRFDRGRAELVLDAPITLASGLRLDAMRTELAPLAGRLSLGGGWRAFRHRRSTLVEARASIGLRELGTFLGRTLGLGVEAIAVGDATISLAAIGEAIAIAVEASCGTDGEDLLVVLEGARALPPGPRQPLGLVVDQAARLGATLDRERGALRIGRPLRWALASALLPAGLRIPATAGLSLRASLEGDRVVLAADRTAGGAPAPTRALLERARAEAGRTAACVEADEPGPEASSPIVAAAESLARALAAEASSADAIARAAEDYAARERHAAIASSALLAAAERVASDRSRASQLAVAAIERGGLEGASALARAIELGTAGAAKGARTLPWEPLSRALEGGGPTVLRARALALESAGRFADALVAFSDALRARPDDDAAQRGLARSLEALGRADEALSAWDRVAQRGGDGADEARLRAARVALDTGHLDGAIARLSAIVSSTRRAPSALSLAAHAELGRALALRGRTSDALESDRALPRITDALGALDADASATALRAAITRAEGAADPSLARTLVAALARALGPLGIDELARYEAAIEAREEEARAAADPAVLRAQADAQRAGGDLGGAARTMIALFARTRDAAVLRAAVELADRADAETRREVIDRALALLPAGPARDAIAARR